MVIQKLCISNLKFNIKHKLSQTSRMNSICHPGKLPVMFIVIYIFIQTSRLIRFATLVIVHVYILKSILFIVNNILNFMQTSPRNWNCQLGYQSWKSPCWPWYLWPYWWLWAASVWDAVSCAGVYPQMMTMRRKRGRRRPKRTLVKYPNQKLANHLIFNFPIDRLAICIQDSLPIEYFFN